MGFDAVDECFEHPSNLPASVPSNAWDFIIQDTEIRPGKYDQGIQMDPSG